MNRDEILAALRTRPDVSVLIVGAGINGIGTFRDLALNGVDVLLVDRGDFCGGASAASSHMAHGGIRYLENGEFRLVREAVRERNFMIEHAPHLVKPLPTTIPIFRTFSGLLNAPLKFLGILDRPSERGSLVIKLGLMLYDAYTGQQGTVPRHRFLDKQTSLGRWPELNPKIVHTATYYDGAILHPERLGLELILDAEDANPQARAINYASLGGRKGAAVIIHDELTGEELEVRPKVLVNAAGPWIDLANGALGVETRLIGGTKGSHIVLEHPELRGAIGEHEFFFENSDGRIVLIFPLYDKVLVGTSDIAVSDPDSARCSNEEVDYFLGLVKRVFPKIRVDRSHIVYRFSGVRPLAASNKKTTGQITRDHEVQELDTVKTGLSFPIYSLVGGKWTSWRAFSEDAAARVLTFLGRRRDVGTQNLPVGGGKSFPVGEAARARLLTQIEEVCGQGAGRAADLLERYGSGAIQVAEFLAAEQDAALNNIPSFTRRELGFLAMREKAVHLDDVLQRRTNLAMLGQLSRAGVWEAADVIGAFMGWNADTVEREVARTLGILTENHQARL